MLSYRFNPNRYSSPVKISDFTRKDLAVLFAELGLRRGAEIGVDAGQYSKDLCNSIPEIEIYCVDPWSPQPDYPWGAKTQEEMDDRLKRATRRVRGFNSHILRTTSMDAEIDGLLDFVYLDANHIYSFVMEDLEKWHAKVRPGGIVAGHDYCDRFDVIDAVHGFTALNFIDEWFVTDEEYATYFWVKRD